MRARRARGRGRAAGRGRDLAAVLRARRRGAARAPRRRRPCRPSRCRSTSTSSRRASGYAVPVPVLERLRERAPNFAGLKVSDKPFEAVEPYLLDGLDVFVGAEELVRAGHGARLRRARSPASPRSSRSGSSHSSATGAATRTRCGATLDRFPFQAAAKYVLGRRGVPMREDVRAPLRTLPRPRSGSWTRGSNRRSRRGRDRRVGRVPPGLARRARGRPR